MSFFVGYLVGINGFFNERAMRGNRDNPGDPAAVVAVPATIAVPSTPLPCFATITPCTSTTTPTPGAGKKSRGIGVPINSD